ncbi:hypothetical protein NP570_24695 [Vibrio parahaemolyticus]|nr:hypothetical protein [Vibrio parahaemolyticus]
MAAEPPASPILIKPQTHTDKLVKDALAAVALIEEQERNDTTNEESGRLG